MKPCLLQFVLLAALLPALSGTSVFAANPNLHDVIDDYQAGRYAEAETTALTLATVPEMPTPQAWLIVAAARQKTGRPQLAAEAYEAFLTSEPSLLMREYAFRQLTLCRRQGDAENPDFEELSPQTMDLLARVSETPFSRKTEHFQIFTWNEALVEQIAKRGEHHLRQIREMILPEQSTLPCFVEVYVWPNHAMFADSAPGAMDHAGASTCFTGLARDITARIDLVQTGVDGQFDLDLLQRQLPHEICHIVLRSFFREVNLPQGPIDCPLAIEEGLATLCETGPANRQYMMIAGRALITTPEIYRLDSLLAYRKYNQIRQLDGFYAVSYSFLDFLRDRLTPEQFRLFLQELRYGRSVREAIQRALLLPETPELLAQIEEAWSEYTVLQGQLLEVLSSALPEETTK